MGPRWALAKKNGQKRLALSSALALCALEGFLGSIGSFHRRLALLAFGIVVCLSWSLACHLTAWYTVAMMNFYYKESLDLPVSSTLSQLRNAGRKTSTI